MTKRGKKKIWKLRLVLMPTRKISLIIMNFKITMKKVNSEHLFFWSIFMLLYYCDCKIIQISENKGDEIFSYFVFKDGDVILLLASNYDFQQNFAHFVSKILILFLIYRQLAFNFSTPIMWNRVNVYRKSYKFLSKISFHFLSFELFCFFTILT